MGRSSRALIAGLAAVAFVVLLVVVSTGALDQLDVAARGFFRPHDEWGTTQRRADRIVEGARPAHAVTLLALAAIAVALRRRSLRPLLFAALTGGAAAIVTLTTKIAYSRTDPHGQLNAHRGSFPSGHALGVLVCLGVALLLALPSTRWWQWCLVAIAGAAMDLALLVEAAHWLTDIVGATLIGVATLCAAASIPLRRPSRSGQDHHSGQPPRA